MKSLKNTKVATIILAGVCLSLLAIDVVQQVQFNKMLKQQADKYTELMKIGRAHV